MKNYRLCIAPVLVAMVLTIAPPLRAEKLPRCDCNELGAAAPVWRLKLYAKEPTTWRIIPTGPQGELTIDRRADTFRFHASGLKPTTRYGLCHYPGSGSVGALLAHASTSPSGHLDFTGTGPIPPGKIWLVRYDDLTGVTGSLVPGAPVTLRSWHPASYLFESELLP